MKFVLTVDTEADSQWEHKENISVKNLQYIAPFQGLCEEFNIKPTYLLSYEIVESPDFQKYLLPYIEKGTADFGAHLHPWTAPPRENLTENDYLNHPFPTEYPIELFSEKLRNLTDKIYEKVGSKPACYRAGRWGINGSHLEVLEGLGYICDTSVTPNVSWRMINRGSRETRPDFRNAPLYPYLPDYKNIQAEGTSKILEVPMTIIFNKPKVLRSMYYNFEKLATARKIMKKLRWAPIWLRPLPYYILADLVGILQYMQKKDYPVINMMIHSSELMPNGSPYYPDGIAEKKLHNLLRHFFMALKTNKVEGVGLSDFAVKKF